MKARVNQRKMIQKKNSALIRKKQMRIKGNQKNHEITSGCAMKRRRCSAFFVRNLRRQTPLHQQKGVQISVPLKIKMSPKILAKGTNCPPVIKSQLKPCLYLCYWHSHSEQSLVLFNLGQYYCIILLKYFTLTNTKKCLSAYDLDLDFQLLFRC